MRAIAAAPSAANDQANQFDQQAQDVRMQGLSAPPPQAVNPAYRTPDAIGLLLGALLSGGNNNSFAEFMSGYQQAKQGKAAQDTQRNQQNYQLGQAKNELQATGFERKAANARTMATGLNRGMQQAADDAESRRRFNLTLDRNLENDKFKIELANRRLGVAELVALSKLPDALMRKAYAMGTLKLSETEADKYANKTSKEIADEAQAELLAAQAALTAARKQTEDATRQPKIDAIVAGTDNKKAGTADIKSRTDERKKLLPGKLNAQMRADALKASQVEMNDARIVKINADIQAQAKQVENSWRNVTSQIETRGRTGGSGKVAGVTPTARYNAYDRELVAIRKQRDGLIKSRREYNAALQLGDPKLKAFYETAIADVDKLITDLGVAGAAAAKKRDAVLAPVPPAAIDPAGIIGNGTGNLPPTVPSGGGPAPATDKGKSKGKGGRVPATGGNANASKFELRIK